MAVFIVLNAIVYPENFSSRIILSYFNSANLPCGHVGLLQGTIVYILA